MKAVVLSVPVQITADQEAAIVDHGWRLADEGGIARRYEKDELSLNLFQYTGLTRGEGIRATVYPSHRPGSHGQCAIVGRGAKARAAGAARVLWDEHEGYLAKARIALEEVAIVQHVGRGTGSTIQPKPYIRSSLF